MCFDDRFKTLLDSFLLSFEITARKTTNRANERERKMGRENMRLSKNFPLSICCFGSQGIHCLLLSFVDDKRNRNKRKDQKPFTLRTLIQKNEFTKETFIRIDFLSLITCDYFHSNAENNKRWLLFSFCFRLILNYGIHWNKATRPHFSHAFNTRTGLHVARPCWSQLSWSTFCAQ